MLTRLVSFTPTSLAFRSTLKLAVAFLTLFSMAMWAQTPAYHLHSDTNGKYLSNAVPEVAAASLSSQDLKSLAVGEYQIQQFLTPVGVPNVGGVIPSGTGISFSLWMRKTADKGTMYPRVKLFLNSTSGTQVCSVTGTTQLTTVLTKFNIYCGTTSNLPVITTDRLLLWVGVNLTQKSTQSFKAELDVEGALDGNYDSQISNLVILPPPRIAIVDPSSAHVANTVAIIGTNLSSYESITFNGTPATVIAHTDTGISVWVPTGATTGNVIVTVAGQQSNGVPFTVTPYPPGTNRTFHLRQGGGYFSGDKFLDPNPSNAASVFLDSGNLKSRAGSGANFGTWDAGSGWSVSGGVPGVVPPGTTVTFSVWMKKTTAIGTIHPYASIGYILWNTYGGYYMGKSLCDAVASASLNTTLTKYTFTCATIENRDLYTQLWTNNPFLVSVGFTWVGDPFPASDCDVLLYYDGAPDTSYDSGVVIPEVLYSPTINEISPTSGPLGGVVDIRGRFFTGDPIDSATAVVTFNGVVATPSTITYGSIVTPVPAGATSGPVVVTAAGNASNAVVFTVAPNISTISPTSGPPGTPVTITGSSFGASSSGGIVQFNGTSATPTNWTNNTIVVPVPAGASTGPITVSLGNASSNGIVFAVPPAISGLTPSSGSSGTVVTIDGSGFGPVQSTSTVTFNGKLASPVRWSSARVVVPVPAGTITGPTLVTVNSLSSNGIQFTIGLGTIAGIISLSSDSSPVLGARVDAISNNVVAGTSTTTSDGSYSISNLPAGNYDLHVSKTALGTKLVLANVVAVNATTTVNVALSSPGTLAGKVAQSDGVTGISGATIVVSQGDTPAETTTTDSAGNYSITSLTAGTYSAHASATGFTDQTLASVAIVSGNTTTSNFALVGQHAINYTYDELGRLVGVVDSLGDAAQYHYDAVGNILSISRNPSTQVSIIDFTPKNGTVGTQVTISGTGFSANPNQDSVTVNGTTATISSAGSTQLIVEVPPGATTGTIHVTAPAGGATSSGAFTVTSGNGAPTISSFTPPNGATGAAVTITGTNFDPAVVNNRLQFNLTSALASSATPTSITVPVPSPVSSGHISLSTRSGRVSSSQDFFVPFGSHVPADIGATGRMSTNGTQPLSLSTANKIGLMLFDGIAGQMISIRGSSSSFGSCTLLLIDPYGNQLASTSCTGAISFLDAQLVRYSGTYTIGIDPNSSIGSLNLTVDGFVDQTANLVLGTPSGIAISSPGQKAIYSFSGVAGQQANVTVSDWTVSGCPTGSLTILRPDGSQLTFANLCNGAASTGATVLPTTGRYQAIFDPTGPNTGTAAINLALQ